MTIEEAQATVDQWIKTTGVRYFNELTNTAILMEEVGEVARIMARKYGEQSFKNAQKEAGLKQKLVGFEMIDRGIPRHDYEICDANGKVIGKVTSGTQSPSLQKAIGLGYVQSDFAKEDTEIFINIRENLVKAQVVKFPFYKG